jgi:hypothetical protein
MSIALKYVQNTMSGLPCSSETIKGLAAEVEDIGEDIQYVKMEFTNGEEYDSDDGFIASESEPTVYSDLEDDDEANDKKKGFKHCSLVKYRRRRIIVDSDSEEEVQQPKPRRRRLIPGWVLEEREAKRVKEQLVREDE